MLHAKAVRASVACVSFLLFWVGFARSQEIVPRSMLEVSKEIPVGNLAYANLVLPHRCDTKGNIYLRFASANMFTSPVLKFTSEGEQKARFATEAVKDWEGADIYEYAIGSDGQVYLLASKFTKEKKYEFGILTFDDEGHHRFSIRLNPSFDSVDNLTVLPSGAFLIIGSRKTEDPDPQIPGAPSAEQKKSKPPVEPMLLIMNRNGDVATEVALRGGATRGEPDDPAQQLKVPASAVHLTSLVAGDDGNVYLLLRTEKPTVYVLSASGQVVRTFSVELPTEESVPFRLALAPGAGLILTSAEKVVEARGTYYPGDKTYFSLINPQTGERLYDYQSNSKLGAGLACYTPQGMLFLGKSEQKLVIRKATFR